jgi:hypothetical protein
VLIGSFSAFPVCDRTVDGRVVRPRRCVVRFVVARRRLLFFVLLLSCPGVLEPDLCDPFAETSRLGNAFEVLAVGVRVEIEVDLEYL